MKTTYQIEYKIATTFLEMGTFSTSLTVPHRDIKIIDFGHAAREG